MTKRSVGDGFLLKSFLVLFLFLQNDFRAKLSLLNEKIERTDSVVLQITDMQNKLKVTFRQIRVKCPYSSRTHGWASSFGPFFQGAANSRKTALSSAYQQLRDMLAQDERAALHEVDCELEKGQMKLQHFAKRFSENNEKMRTAREDINELLRRSQTTAFLQVEFVLEGNCTEEQNNDKTDAGFYFMIVSRPPLNFQRS